MISIVMFFSRRKVDNGPGPVPTGNQMEKAITVYGQPENCTAACKRILEVMEEEAKNVGKEQEICLRILAHNNLIGRIIGKQGAIIKKIM
jgi:insulin-like growth factor 2 mRNA-binding protein 1